VLAGYYAVADVAFVGGSLRPYGGHNPLEPAACGAAILMGPWHAAQADGVRGLAARGAIDIVAGPSQLAESLRLVLADRATRERRAAAGLAVVESRRGAARRAVEALRAWQVWPPA
jgi:3-deoxy-D-manno-octulosonic-acid transferase